MHIACKCLNVSIKSRGTELQKFNINDIELTLEEQNDSFFHQVKIFLKQLLYIFIKHSILKNLYFKSNHYRIFNIFLYK